MRSVWGGEKTGNKSEHVIAALEPTTTDTKKRTV
jgi:hypothetical protein